MKQKQTERILNYIDRFGSITQDEAAMEFGCRRLAARIYDLKRDGVKIETEIVYAKNRYGEPVSYARYRRER